MKITNKYNLPDTFLSFARDGKYDKGHEDGYNEAKRDAKETK